MNDAERAQIKMLCTFINGEFLQYASGKVSGIEFCTVMSDNPQPLLGNYNQAKYVREIGKKCFTPAGSETKEDNIYKVRHVTSSALIKKYFEESEKEDSIYMPPQEIQSVYNIALSYFKNTLHQNEFTRLRKIFSVYMVILPKSSNPNDILEQSDGSFFGLLIKKKFFEKEDAKVRLEHEKNRGFEVDMETETVEGDDVAYTDKTLEKIEELERGQGYNYNTTLLKKAIELKYFTKYQLKILEDFEKYDDFYLVGNRRAGKTWFFVYLAIRQLFLKNQTVLYVVPTENFMKQPMKYFERFLNMVQKSDKNIRFRKDENAIHNDETQSVIWFVSANSQHGVRSNEATLAIIDEASFVKDSEALSVETMLAQVRSMREQGMKDVNIPVGKLICGSTINKKTPKNWFYRDVRSAESGLNPNGLSIRVGVFQCPFYSDIQREILIRKYADDPEGLKCEMLAEFPSQNERYDLEEMTLEEGELKQYSSKHSCIVRYGQPRFFTKQIGVKPILVMGYDPAKKQTNAGVTLEEVYYNQAFPQKSKIVALGEVEIPKQMPYMKQAEVIADVHEKFGEYYSQIFVVIDNGGVGEPVSEMVAAYNLNLTKVQYLGGASLSRTMFVNAPYKNNNGIFYIQKDFLMDIIPNLAANKRFQTWKSPRLFSDFEAYNDVHNFSFTKESIDYYNSLSIATFFVILRYPEIYYDEEFVKKRKNKQSFDAQVNSSLQRHGQTGIVKPKNSRMN